MKLYIRFGSLYSFQLLFNGNEYLQNVLTKVKSNAYSIKKGEDDEIERLLTRRNINFVISE